MARRGTRVGIEGGRELAKKFSELRKEAENGLEEALVKSALFVERDAKINAPVDTGRMRASISHTNEGFGTDNPSVQVGTNVKYAPAVEFGTSKKPAKPFLFPAFNGNKQKILKELAKALKGGVGL
jgi:HK97 gp10 family phage protein